MAEVTGAGAATDEGGPPEYDAFLSYAHRDRHVSSAIQKGLHQIGRRLGRLRALRVFRDDTNLAASPDLWGKITEALDRARSDDHGQLDLHGQVRLGVTVPKRVQNRSGGM